SGHAFDPILYELSPSPPSSIVSNVRYAGPLGSGWLSASGEYSFTADRSTILFRDFWWVPETGLFARSPPPPSSRPGAGPGDPRAAFPRLVRSLGRLGFRPEFGTFPIKSLAADEVRFEFEPLGSVITARKQPTGTRLFAHPEGGEPEPGNAPFPPPDTHPSAPPSPPAVAPASVPASQYHARRAASLRADPSLSPHLKRLQTLPPPHRSPTLPLAFLVPLSLLSLSLLPLGARAHALLAVTAGATLSSLHLQVLHDIAHGLLFRRRSRNAAFLFLLSQPAAFGYYLYLKNGHLSHHSKLGTSSLGHEFSSPDSDFTDGDVLFAAHRSAIPGPTGPVIAGAPVSVSRSFFSLWRPGRPLRNYLLYAAGFSLERALLVLNDALTALLGRNLFFPNKPADFHRHNALYARYSLLVSAALCGAAGSLRPLLFLYLSELAWSLPPHPASAIFLTNHGSPASPAGECEPTASLYPGRWLNCLTLNMNLHVEHHDLPAVPFYRLHELSEQAGEGHYPRRRTGVWSTIRDKMAEPDFYACGGEGA
ncbi:hypothetical protein TeGR_g11517, partial [Tetraparma gracilis]